MERKFKLGKVVATCGIDERMKQDKEFYIFVMESLKRYTECDWGDTCKEDRRSNEEALLYDERILAVYIRPATKETIWIITEWDRSVTTVLLPEEY